MSITLDLEALLALIDGDQECLDCLVEGEFLSPEEVRYEPEQIDLVLVAHTLVRELEVNWPGVEVVLRMRAELLATRRQLRDLLDALRQHGPPRPGGEP